jgi:hypothetical protein
MISELFRECGIVLHDFGTVLTVWYFSTWFRNCFDSVVFPTLFPNWTVPKSCRKYYTVRTVPKSCRKYYTVRTIPKSCRKYYTVRTVQTVLTVWYFSTGFRNCADSVVFFDMISELFWQCGIFLHDFGTVLTAWYFSTWFRNCFDRQHCQSSSEII